MTDARLTLRPAAQRSDVFTLVLHWVMVVALIVSLLTGLRVAVDYDGSVAGGFAGWLVWLLLEGRVIDWHIWSGWTLTFIAIAYAVFLWRSGETVRVKLDRSVWRRISQARRSGKLWSSEPAWSAVNVVLYQLAFLLIAIMAVTGWMQYWDVTFGLSLYTVSTVHGVASYGFVLYVVVHILSQLKTGTFWKIFRPRLAHTVAAMLAVLVSAAAVVAAYVFDRGALADLRVAKVDQAPKLDGDPNDPIWGKAHPVAIHTTRGANLPNGAVTVDVKALHDGERAYFQFSWPDPQRSQKHLPLVKVEGGWRVLQSEFEINDEDEFYEDKFSVALAPTPALGSGTAHLGQNLINGPHLPTTRGLHYTENGRLVDMWHWKSVRTGNMTPAMVDDDHFGPPTPSEKPGARYTGGYAQDPNEAGGYTLNWTKLEPDKPLAETLVVPKFLPVSADLLARIGTPDLDPDAGDEGQWYLAKGETVPYEPELDHYPVGTVLPSVVIDGPFAGDRGDVLAGARWQAGRWTLEVSRLLDTGSEFDVPLVAGQNTYLWVAVFNHTQTRHSQHLHPVRVVLE